jgi:hypothetical protein
MKQLGTMNASECVLCGGRLRNAVFCRLCGRSSCSWACYLRHLGQHSVRTESPFTYQSDARGHDGQDPADHHRPHR